MAQAHETQEVIGAWREQKGLGEVAAPQEVAQEHGAVIPPRHGEAKQLWGEA